MGEKEPDEAYASSAPLAPGRAGAGAVWHRPTQGHSQAPT